MEVQQEVMEAAAEKLIKYLSADKNVLKVVEECAELQEVMVKYLTKSEELKPKKEKIIEEMGDVLFRIMVVSKMMDIEEAVYDRAEEKAGIMYKWAVEKFEKQN